MNRDATTYTQPHLGVEQVAASLALALQLIDHVGRARYLGMAVGRIETVTVFLIVAGVASAAGWSVYSTRAENEARNAPARAAGFRDADDMLRAKSLGFSSSAEWKAESQRRAELERLAQAQADAKAQQAKREQDAKDAVESAKAAIAKKIDDARFAEGMIYAHALKQAMKNPDSFNLEQALRMADGTFCFQYRATNSFNAIVPGKAFFGKGKYGVSDGTDGFASQWNRHCGGKSGDNFSTITYAINHGY